MSLEEKVSQLQTGAPGIPRLGLPAFEWWSGGRFSVAQVTEQDRVLQQPDAGSNRALSGGQVCEPLLHKSLNQPGSCSNPADGECNRDGSHACCPVAVNKRVTSIGMSQLLFSS
jgi:hypothetical protein